MLPEAKKPFLLHNKFAKMQDISPLVPALRNEVSDRATTDGLWDLPGNSVSVPFPVLDLSRTHHPRLSLSTQRCSPTWPPAHLDFHMNRAVSTISLFFPPWCTSPSLRPHSDKRQCENPRALPFQAYPPRQGIPQTYGSGKVGWHTGSLYGDTCRSMLWYSQQSQIHQHSQTM